jgi:thiamine pyrophosphate-dependent acetolactate synthase large subunit-like protein
VRREGQLQLIGYEVHMESGDLEAKWQTHADAGQEHPFIAYRAEGAGGPAIRLATPEELEQALAEAEGRSAPA